MILAFHEDLKQEATMVIPALPIIIEAKFVQVHGLGSMKTQKNTWPVIVGNKNSDSFLSKMRELTNF
jgi:hypothetical protein